MEVLYNEYLEQTQNNPEDNLNSSSQDESPRNDSDSESFTTETSEEEIQLVASIQSDSQDAEGILKTDF